MVRASLESLTASAAGVTGLPADLRLFSLNARGKSTYPLSWFCYVLVYKKQTDAKKAKALTEFLKWAVTDGRTLAADLHYARLPERIVKADLNLIDSIVVK